jgi:hypothetical protein
VGAGSSGVRTVGHESMKCSCAAIVSTEANRRGTEAYIASHCRQAGGRAGPRCKFLSWVMGSYCGVGRIRVRVRVPPCADVY